MIGVEQGPQQICKIRFSIIEPIVLKGYNHINTREEGAIYSITNNDLNKLIEDLKKEFRIVGPVKTKEEAVFSKYQFVDIEDPKDLVPHYPITAVPPTKYLFPSRENIIEFEGGKQKNKKAHPKTIIWGVSSKDTLAISRLDEEFSQPIKDEIYEKRRKNTYIFSMDYFTPIRGAKYDLHFYPIKHKDMYDVVAGSGFGKEIIKKEHFFKKEKSIKKGLDLKSQTPINHPELPEIIEYAKNDPIWDELAEICFGCGICTYVCPVCYCFEAEDKIKMKDLNLKQKNKCNGCRERRWDSCLLPDFANTAQVNFRPELRNRIYNWYHHKFVRTPREHGFPGCVDCERCIVYCPAKINFHEILNHLIKEYT